jgi:hypothetical protein
MKFQDFAETTAFRQVVRTITALSIQDERIADEFRSIEKGRISSGKIVEIKGDVLVGLEIKLGDFADAISTRIWQSVGQANWRPFEDARNFARGLNLKSEDDWRAYCKSGRKPADIPGKPYVTYANTGWVGMGDWLGTGTIATYLRRYRSFRGGRAFARRLNLKSGSEWKKYCKSGKTPDDIPFAPWIAYKATGWVGMGDWLGTGTIASSLREYRSFKEARTFGRSLAFQSREQWYDYCKSGKKPADIPAQPQQTYATAGWAGWSDWLGRTTYLREFRSFGDARAFARRLGLKSSSEWHEYCLSKKKPGDIPSNPDKAYAKTGWVGMGDWLGTETVASHLREYRSFKKAREFVRGLGLNSQIEWSEYCRSGKKPYDIPATPGRTYRATGWAGMGDWLGTGRVADQRREYRPFKKARSFVRALQLKSTEDWFEYRKSSRKPIDIPGNPNRTYLTKGWEGYPDWLGYLPKTPDAI